MFRHLCEALPKSTSKSALVRRVGPVALKEIVVPPATKLNAFSPPQNIPVSFPLSFEKLKDGAAAEPLPKSKMLEKRLVLDAVVAKKLVVVAEVPVALTKVRF